MQDQNKAAQNYLEKQIMTASPAERIVLLYDGAIKFLLLARKDIENGDIQSRFNHNKRAGDIITYLMATLDKEKGGEIAENLERLYMHMLHRLMDVDLKNDMAAIDDVVAKLKTLRVSWEKIANGEVGLEGQESPKKVQDSPVEEGVKLKKHNALA
jgi:flagellar protein FliS